MHLGGSTVPILIETTLHYCTLVDHDSSLVVKLVSRLFDILGCSKTSWTCGGRPSTPAHVQPNSGRQRVGMAGA